jgi:group I intron endonuclease
MRTTFIYCLFDPITDAPKYIGKSDNPKKRFLEHMNEKYNNRKCNWIKSLKKKNLKPYLEIIDEVNIDVWEIMEIMYISLFKGWGFDLVNGTYGGDGAHSRELNPMYGKRGKDNPNYGKKLSEERKNKLRENQLGSKNSFFGKKHSVESLKKISQGSKGSKNPNYGGKYHSEEYFKKQSESNSKVPLIVIDSFENKEYEFLNSKQVALFLGVGHSLVRMAKLQKFKVRKRYIIKEKNNGI